LQWPDSEKLISQGSFGQVLSFLSHVKITQATGSRRGTQLKLELLLEGGRLAFFKVFLTYKTIGFDLLIRKFFTAGLV